MTAEKKTLSEVLLIKTRVYGDNRGWFMETYSTQAFEKLGITCNFVQDNHSFSMQKGVLRGLHFQKNPRAQSKLIRCTHGEILDVVVDIRKGSPDYLRWQTFGLSKENKDMLFIPKGFAHGFVTLTDNVEIQYKVDELYSPEHDRSIRWDDPAIGIDWGIENPILSEKDRNAPFLTDSDFNFAYGG